MNLDKVKAVQPGNYDMNFADLRTLSQYAANCRMEAIILAFKYGFMHGQNAEKASAKRRAVQA